MKQKLHIQIADPAGNITALVLTPVPRSRYREVARKILSIPGISAEQVGFVTGPRSLEMSGMEFCGNASRAFALLRARQEGAAEEISMQISISGTDAPLTATVDPAAGTARIEMPLPERILRAEHAPYPGIDGTPVIDFGGILHLVTDQVPEGEEAFRRLRIWLCRTWNPPAAGVMFLRPQSPGETVMDITPYVYVRDVDSTYREGSCGSGTAAAIIRKYLQSGGDSVSADVRQPAGTIRATASGTGGQIRRVMIESPVTFPEAFDLELES